MRKKRMKQIIGAILSVALLFSNVNTAYAAETDTHNHPLCGTSCKCTSSTHTSKTWTEWDGKTTLYNGYYYLTKDIVLDSTKILNTGYTSYLCLNGHSITCENTVFDIYSTTSLLISDCVGTGKIETTKGAFTIKNNKYFSLWGGTILNSSDSGDAIAAYDTTNTYVNGGKVESLDSSAIYTDIGSNVQIKGGIVQGKEAAIQGAGSSSRPKSLTISGGTLTCGENGYNQDVIDELYCKFTMTGGYVEGNAWVGFLDANEEYPEYPVNVSGGTITGAFWSYGNPTTITGGDMALNSFDDITVSGGTYRRTCYFQGDNTTITGGDFSKCEKILVSGKTWISGGSYSTIQVDDASLYLSGVPEIQSLVIGCPSKLSAQNPDRTGSYGGEPIEIRLDHPYSDTTWKDGDVIVKDVKSANIAEKFVLSEEDSEWMYLEYTNNSLVLREIPHGTWGDNVTWTLVDGVLTVSGEGKIKETYIGTEYPWGDNCDEIKKVIVEPGITNIPHYTFEYCENVETIILPETLERISLAAFNDCGSLNNLLMPSSLNQIISPSFVRCESLTDVYYLGTAEEWSAVENSQDIRSTDSELTMHFLVKIDSGATCTQEGNQSYYQFDDTSVYKDKYDEDKNVITQLDTVPALGHSYDEGVVTTEPTLTTEGVKTYTCTVCGESKEESIPVLPDPNIVDSGTCGENATWKLDKEGTLTISGTGAISDNSGYGKYHSSVTKLVIEEGITEIGARSFSSWSDFTGTLTIPESVTKIGNHAFYNCNGFTGELVIPESVTEIGNYAFYYCSGLTGELVIPESVTEIGNYAFYYCSGLTGELIISEGVTEIGNYAFSNCSGFTGKLILPESVTKIGNHAFYNCNGLTGELVIPERVTEIENHAFYNCSGFTGELVIPERVTEIGNYAFYYCSGLTGELILPESVTKIGASAFYNCNGFTGELVISENVLEIGDAAFVLCCGIKNVELTSEKTSTIGKNAFWGIRLIHNLSSASGSPWGAQSVHEYSKEDCQLCELDDGGLNENNEVILTGKCGATEEDNLIWTIYDKNRDNIPDELEISGTGRMADYSETDVPWKVTYFEELNLEIKEGVTHIGNGAFRDMSILTGELSIPNSVTSIGEFAFDNCHGLTGDLIIPDSVTSIGTGAFDNCHGLTGDLIIPDSVTSIGAGAFFGCKGFDGNLVISSNVTVIEFVTFNGCYGLTGELVIPSSVIEIEEFAFVNCTEVANVDLGNNVTEIGENAFGNMKLIHNSSQASGSPWGALEVHDYPTDNCQICKTGDYGHKHQIEVADYNWASDYSECEASLSCVADDCDEPMDLQLKAEITSALSVENSEAKRIYTATVEYDGETFTDTKEKVLEDIAACGTCGENAIWILNEDGTLTISGTGDISDNSGYSEYKRSITKLVIEEGITEIRDYAFEDFRDLEGTLELPASLVWIGDNAFSNCDGLGDTLEIPEGITGIGDRAFQGCNNLSGLKLPNSLIYIGSRTFSGCSNIKGEISIPNSVTTVDSYAFEDCSGITKIVLPDKLSVIDYGVFYGCSGLAGEMIIPPSVKKIGGSAFWGCSNLTQISLPEKLEEIGDHAFYECSKLSGELKIPDGIRVLENCTFYGCSSLTKVIIPEKVKAIGAQVFNGCSSLSEVNLPAGISTISDMLFYECTSLETIEIPSGVTSIGDYAFYQCTSLKDIVLPEGVTSIGEYAFDGCTSLEEIIFPEGVKTISSCMFQSCKNLKKVELPKNVESIENGVFNNCSQLSEIAIYNKDCKIVDEWSVFDGNTTLKGYIGSTLQAYAQKHNRKFICLEHDWDAEPTIDTEANCFKPGSQSIHCSGCNEVQDIQEIPASGKHPYEVVSFNWSSDYENCNIYLRCTTKGCGTECEEQCTISVNIVTEAGCQTEGKAIYTASFEVDEQTYTDEVEVRTEATGHSEVVSKEAKDATCTEAGCTEEIQCSRCEEILTDSVDIPATGHKYYSGTFSWKGYKSCEATFTCNNCNTEEIRTCDISVVNEKAPSCTKEGENVYTASCVVDGKTFIAKATELVPATGHTYKEPAFDWASDYSTCEATFECEQGDDSKKLICEVTVEKTSGAEAMRIYTASCEFDGKTFTDEKTEKIPDTELYSTAEISVGTAKAYPGEIIEVPVVLEENPGISSMRLKFTYDAEVLTPVAVNAGDMLKGVQLTGNVDSDGIYYVLWSQAKDMEETGVLYNIEFQVSEDAAIDTVTEIQVSSEIGDVCDVEHNDIATVTTAGVVNIQNKLLGDIFGDGKLNSHDILELQQFMTDLVELTKHQLNLADINGDGAVNMKDVVALAKLLVNPSEGNESAATYSLRLAKVGNEKFDVIVGNAVRADDNKVNIPVQFENCPGIAAFKFKITYDSSVAELTDITSTNSIVNNNMMVNLDKASEGEAVVTWYSNSDQQIDGEAFVLSFNMKNDVSGDKLNVSISHNIGDVCNEDLEDVEVVYSNEFVENKPEVELKFRSASLTLQDNLAINFKAKSELFGEGLYQNPYVVFSFNGEEVTVTDYRIVGTDYVFDFINIAPHQMNDTLSATLYAKHAGKEYVSSTVDYSVAKYAYNMLNKSTAEQTTFRTLLVDLLNYGAQAQQYMTYNTENFVNASLTEEQAAWGTAESRTYESLQEVAYETIDNPTVAWKSAGLNLKDRVEIRVKIAADSSENLSLKARLDDGSEWIIPAEKFEETTGGYYIYFNGLNAGQMSEAVYFTVYNGDTAVSNTLRYSVESYAANKMSGNDEALKDILKAMMKYGDAAKDYVN